MGDRRHQNPFLPKSQASAPSSARCFSYFYGVLLNFILWHRGNPSGPIIVNRMQPTSLSNSATINTPKSEMKKINSWKQMQLPSGELFLKVSKISKILPHRCLSWHRPNFSQFSRPSSCRLPAKDCRVFAHSRALERHEHLQAVERDTQCRAILDLYRDAPSHSWHIFVSCTNMFRFFETHFSLLFQTFRLFLA